MHVCSCCFTRKASRFGAAVEAIKRALLGEVAISWSVLFLPPHVITVHSVYAKWGKMQMFMQNEGYC